MVFIPLVEIRIPYFSIGIVVLAVLFWLLLITSASKIFSYALSYGVQKGIGAILTAIYVITLCINTATISLIIFHEIRIHPPFLRDDHIENIVRLIGSYVILYLNFTINCLILASLLALSCDTFGFKLKRTLKKRLIYFLFISSGLYLIIVTVFAILIEVIHIDIFILNLKILSFIHIAPIAVNIVISLICVCKLPIIQPLDLSIGLYQKNTKCSCYTRVTRYAWCLSMIAVSQGFPLALYILDIDIWNIDEYRFKRLWMDILRNNDGLLIYFASELCSLLWFWSFVQITFKQSFEFYIILNAIKPRVPSQILSFNASDIDDNIDVVTRKGTYDKIEIGDQSPVLTSRELNEADIDDNTDVKPRKVSQENVEYDRIEIYTTPSPDPETNDEEVILYEAASGHHTVDKEEVNVAVQMTETVPKIQSVTSESVSDDAESKHDDDDNDDGDDTESKHDDDDGKMQLFETESNAGETETETDGEVEAVDDEDVPPPPLPPQKFVSIDGDGTEDVVQLIHDEDKEDSAHDDNDAKMDIIETMDPHKTGEYVPPPPLPPNKKEEDDDNKEEDDDNKDEDDGIVYKDINNTKGQDDIALSMLCGINDDNDKMEEKAAPNQENEAVVMDSLSIEKHDVHVIKQQISAMNEDVSMSAENDENDKKDKENDDKMNKNEEEVDDTSPHFKAMETLVVHSEINNDEVVLEHAGSIETEVVHYSDGDESPSDSKDNDNDNVATQPTPNVIMEF